MKSWFSVQKIYAQHVLALFRAGHVPPVLDADHTHAGEVDDWPANQLDTLIEEGRRQTDRQNEDLERVRGRAQATLAIGLALEGATGSLRGGVSATGSVALWALWIAALLFVGWAILGAAATAVVSARMPIIHAGVLSNYEADELPRRLAADYAAMVADGEKQIATRLNNLRLAVLYLLIGGLLTLGAWLWADAARAKGDWAQHGPPQHRQAYDHCRSNRAQHRSAPGASRKGSMHRPPSSGSKPHGPVPRTLPRTP